MRPFVKLSILFSIILGSLIFILITSSEYIIQKNADFKLKPNTKYLLLGHSHPECAFNDTLINNFKNLAQSGESYFYTLFKAKKTLEQNPSIETVFIEFTNEQINKSIDINIWDDKYINWRYPQYSPFMNFTDKMVLVENNLSGYLNATSLSFKNNFGRVLKQDFSYPESIGGYLYLKRNKTDSLLKTQKVKTIKETKPQISEVNLNYLSKLIRLCKAQGKNVFLIRSPQHKKYAGYSNENTYQNLRKSRYTSIGYLDFSKFPLHNSQFGDLEHLNHKGATIFSNWFAQLIKSGLLEEKNKQALIDKNIAARRRNSI